MQITICASTVSSNMYGQVTTKDCQPVVDMVEGPLRLLYYCSGPCQQETSDLPSLGDK